MDALKILIVEDDAIIRENLREILEEDLGYEVIATADNSKDALKAYVEYHPNIVFVDIELKDGKEAGIDFVKQAQKLRQTTVIYMTGHHENRLMRTKAINTDYDIFLKKSDGLTKGNIEFAIDQVLARQKKNNVYEEYFSLKKDGKHKRIAYDDLIWIKSEGDNLLKIYTEKGIYHYTGGMAKFVRNHQHPSLQRIHQSHIINFNKNFDLDVNNKEIHLIHENKTHVIRISEKYLKTVKNRFNILYTR